MSNRSIQITFTCPHTLLDELETHLNDTGRYRMRSLFVREAVEEKLQRERSEHLLNSKEADSLKSIYWNMHHSDPTDEQVVDWILQGLKYPPGCEPDKFEAKWAAERAASEPEVELDELPMANPNFFNHSAPASDDYPRGLTGPPTT